MRLKRHRTSPKMPPISQHCEHITHMYAASTSPAPPIRIPAQAYPSVVYTEEKKWGINPDPSITPSCSSPPFASKIVLPQLAWPPSILSNPVVTGAHPLCSRAMPCPRFEVRPLCHVKSSRVVVSSSAYLSVVQYIYVDRRQVAMYKSVRVVCVSGRDIIAARRTPFPPQTSQVSLSGG